MKQARWIVAIIGGLYGTSLNAMTWDDAVAQVPKCAEVIAHAQVLAGEHVAWTSDMDGIARDLSCLEQQCGNGCRNYPLCAQSCDRALSHCTRYETRVVTADYIRDCLLPVLKIFTAQTDLSAKLVASQVNKLETTIPTEIAKQAEEVIASGSVGELRSEVKELRQNVEELRAICSNSEK